MIDEKIVKEKLFGLLSPRLKMLGVKPQDVDDKSSLLLQGVLDSMSFIEFIAEVEDFFNIEIDFEQLDASDFTSVEQLTRLVLKSKTTE